MSARPRRMLPRNQPRERHGQHHRGPRPGQALRRHHRPGRGGPGRPDRHASWACSAPTAPARPPRSASWPRCSSRTPAGPWSAATTCVAQAQQVRQLIGLTGQYAAGRREPHRHREPAADRPPARPVARRAPGAGRPSCWRGSAWPTPAAGPPRPTRAACAAGSTWPPAWSAGRGCCSWTSRPPASTRAARSELWEVVRGLIGDGVTVLLTTQYLEEADQLADDIVVIDHGRVIADGTPGRAQGPGRRAGPEGQPGRARPTCRWWPGS